MFPWQVKLLVPNATVGMIIGKGGSYIRQVKEETSAYVQISQKSPDTMLAERVITIAGNGFTVVVNGLPLWLMAYHCG